MITFPNIDIIKNTISDGGSTALYAAYTVGNVYTVDIVYTVDMVYTNDMVYTVDMVCTVDMVYTAQCAVLTI